MLYLHCRTALSQFDFFLQQYLFCTCSHATLLSRRILCGKLTRDVAANGNASADSDAAADAGEAHRTGSNKSPRTSRPSKARTLPGAPRKPEHRRRRCPSAAWSARSSRSAGTTVAPPGRGRADARTRRQQAGGRDAREDTDKREQQATRKVSGLASRHPVFKKKCKNCMCDSRTG